jgi:hypothetical protein
MNCLISKQFFSSLIIPVMEMTLIESVGLIVMRGIFLGHFKLLKSLNKGSSICKVCGDARPFLNCGEQVLNIKETQGSSDDESEAQEE